MELFDALKWLLQSFGVPLACLYGVAWGIARAAEWLAPNLLKPIIDRALRFFDRLDERMDAQDARHAEQFALLKQIDAKLSENQSVTTA